MKTVLVIADMEGCTLIDSKFQVFTNSLEPADFGRKAMESDVNCVLENLAQLGVTKAFIADWHDTGKNLKKSALYQEMEIELVEDDIQHAFGSLAGQIEGIIFVGFHDKPGTGGVLPHCYSFIVDQLLINGEEAGETTLNIYHAYEHEIPVLLVIGSSGAALEARNMNPEIKTVVTKNGHELIPRENVYAEIKDRLREAIADPAPALKMPVRSMIARIESKDYELKGVSLQEQYTELGRIVAERLKEGGYSEGNSSILQDPDIH